MDSYADSYNLYDIKLLSEYGFEGSDLDSIFVGGKCCKCGAVQIGGRFNGRNRSKTYVADGRNKRRSAFEGRMPQNPGECVWAGIK